MVSPDSSNVDNEMENKETSYIITPTWGVDLDNTYDVDGNSKPGEPPWRVSKFPSAMELDLSMLSPTQQCKDEQIGSQIYLDFMMTNGDAIKDPDCEFVDFGDENKDEETDEDQVRYNLTLYVPC